jgi:hypothetical protein
MAKLITSIDYLDCTTEYTVPAGTPPITLRAWLWGAGGGAGGNDPGKLGGNGAAGALVSVTITVNPGDVIQVAPGGAGSGGIPGKAAPGGIGGKGYVSATNANISFGGGLGGKSGGVGSSGSGGGGGGATVMFINGVLIAVAPGGGGGAGGGLTTPGLSASTATSGSTGLKCMGANGQDKSATGDGGGAGGGGGGYRGGTGGAVISGDVGANPGASGGYYVSPTTTANVVALGTSFRATEGTSGYQVATTHAAGGAAMAGFEPQHGLPGFAVLEFNVKGFPRVKNLFGWQTTTAMYYKVGGEWKPIVDVFNKVNNNWCENSPVATPDFLRLSTLWGSGGTRAYGT